MGIKPESRGVEDQSHTADYIRPIFVFTTVINVLLSNVTTDNIIYLKENNKL